MLVAAGWQDGPLGNGGGGGGGFMYKETNKFWKSHTFSQHPNYFKKQEQQFNAPMTETL